MILDLTRSGWITVQHPTTGEQHSRHVQEREAVESAVNLAAQLRQPVTIRYEQTVRVDVSPQPAPEPTPEPLDPWLTWNDEHITFGALTHVTFGELS